WLRPSSKTKVIPKAIDSVHPLMQYRNDTDIAVRKPAPVNEMLCVTKKIPVDAKLGRDGAGQGFAGLYPIESLEQAGNIMLGLLRSPTIPRVAIDLIEPVGRRLLNPDLCLSHVGCAQSRQLPSMTDTKTPVQRRHEPVPPSTGRALPARCAPCPSGSGRACTR